MKDTDNQINFRELLEKNIKFVTQEDIDPKDIENQFVKTNTRYHLIVGKIDCPTGKIIVSDPLCYLLNKDFSIPLEQVIPKGKYPVEISICRNEYISIRMCTARLKIKDTKAIKYVLAKVEQRDADKKVLDGFFVDAGMMSFCDQQVAEEYRDFIDEWYSKNKDKNHYDDYFAKFFKESEEKLPQYQRQDGDFIEWTNPLSNNKMVMIASGFGDGFYQCYWGYDSENEICELIVPMVNPDLFE